jgi:hypothetical protein
VEGVGSKDDVVDLTGEDEEEVFEVRAVKRWCTRGRRGAAQESATCGNNSIRMSLLTWPTKTYSRPCQFCAPFSFLKIFGNGKEFGDRNDESILIITTSKSLY